MLRADVESQTQRLLDDKHRTYQSIVQKLGKKIIAKEKEITKLRTEGEKLRSQADLNSSSCTICFAEYSNEQHRVVIDYY